MKVNHATTIPTPERKPASPAVVNGGGDFALALDSAAPLPARKPDPTAVLIANAPIPGQKPEQARLLAGGAPIPGQKPDLATVLAANAPIPGQKPDTEAMLAANAPAPGRKPAVPTPAAAATTLLAGADNRRATAASATTAGATTPHGNLSRADMADRIAAASRQAAGDSGHSYKAILAQAAQESRMNVNAKSRTSSAAGPFQFLEKTWLDMFRRHGGAYGYGELASKIQVRDGKAVVSDPAAREKILSLRHDIDVSAGMAARMMSEGRDRLEQRLKRPVSENESRLAYVFGVGGALTLLRAAEKSPQTPAAELLPGAAKANGPLFYDRKTGAPLTVTETLSRMNKKMNADHRDMFAAIDAAGSAMQQNGGASPAGAVQFAADSPADESFAAGRLASDGAAVGTGPMGGKPV